MGRGRQTDRHTNHIHKHASTVLEILKNGINVIIYFCEFLYANAKIFDKY